MINLLFYRPSNKDARSFMPVEFAVAAYRFGHSIIRPFYVINHATLRLSNDAGWGGEAPLWFYILKEAELAPYNAERLGPVGGRIMAEVLVGLLKRDPTSYLSMCATWKPAPPIAPATGQFGFVDLLRYARAV